MSSKLRAMAFLSTVLMMGTGFTPAFAQKAATSTSVKIGYFNLPLVRQNFPEARESEVLQAQADAQLKRDVEEGNKRLEKAREEKKPAEEIQKLVSQLQTEINAKQEALVRLISGAKMQSDQRIVQAANSVASEKGLDLVVDAGAIFTGGQKVIDNGVDITQDVMKKLSPTLGTSAAAPAPSTASASAKQAAK